jgi:hypothetical protein
VSIAYIKGLAQQTVIDAVKKRLGAYKNRLDP